MDGGSACTYRTTQMLLKAHNISSANQALSEVGKKFVINRHVFHSRFLRAYFYLWLYSPLLGFGRHFSFLILYTVGRTPWTGDQPVARPLPTYRATQTQNKHTHRQPCLEWDSNPRSQRSTERRLHASEGATTVIGLSQNQKQEKKGFPFCRSHDTSSWMPVL
jgi:hypothetical protein